MVLGNFRCHGVLLLWIKVEQGPTVVTVGEGGNGLAILYLSIFVLYFLFIFFLSFLKCFSTEN